MHSPAETKCWGGSLMENDFKKKYQTNISEHRNNFSFDKKNKLHKKISESVIHEEKKNGEQLVQLFFLKQSENNGRP